MGTRQTPWTKKHGSLPSDRISSSYSSANQQPGKAKGNRNTNKFTEPPKSKEVRKLESLLSDLRSSSISKTDPKGGCYCQAREHPLSTYSPICRTCGLILCSLNQPSYACPHCNTPLFTGNNLESLIQRIETQLSETIAQEVAERERAIEEARREAGAFPSLSGSSTPTGRALQTNSTSQNTRPAAPQPQTHKVLSLNSKTKKVTVSSYTNTPASSQPASRGESETEEEPFRVPPPPAEVSFVRKQVDPARPWKNYRIEDVKYVSTAKESNKGKEPRRQKKGKTKENKSAENSGVNASGS